MQKRSYRALTALAVGAGLLSLPLTAETPAARAKPLSAQVWNQALPGFGGFSGLEMAADGLSLTALTDRGLLFQAEVRRDAAGRITEVTATGTARTLVDERGTTLSDRRHDSEGLAIADDGGIFVSFEGPARVLRYDRDGGKATPLPVPGEFRALQKNAALEALALGPDGTLYTLPERSGAIDRPFPVYRFRNGQWDQPFAIPRTDMLLPVSADFGPDGRLYILEREFLGLAGFRSRLRSFALNGDDLSDARVLLETATGRHTNLEGLAVWRDARGHLIATMIADDNFRAFLASELVEYDLGPDGQPALLAN